MSGVGGGGDEIAKCRGSKKYRKWKKLEKSFPTLSIEKVQTCITYQERGKKERKGT